MRKHRSLAENRVCSRQVTGAGSILRRRQWDFHGGGGLLGWTDLLKASQNLNSSGTIPDYKIVSVEYKF